ncbi:MAG TPA: ANTAR domain-containing protein [Acetobacteraceae bacterium]|nr:ANTAR domain-containing protein [Acetobacteraceae bacterium]
MTIEILRDLRGMRVQVVHPPDTEGVALIEHLRRIGCQAEAIWPMEDAHGVATDVFFVAVDHDRRHAIQQFARSFGVNAPTLIAVVGYEDPSTLQLVLEAGAHAVIERPIRPFGVLTQLIVARNLWLQQREARQQLQKLERKLAGQQNVQRAKLILMGTQGLTEEEAHRTLRRRAMSKRMAVEELAVSIISADDLLRSRTALR